MKMAKASQADIDLAIKITSILEEADRGMMYTDIAEEDDESFESDNPEHCMRVMSALLDEMRKGGLGRVTWGMYVLLDPDNKMVDPDADTLEHHPERKALEQQAAELSDSLSALQRQNTELSALVRQMQSERDELRGPIRTSEAIDWSLPADEISRQYRAMVLDVERANAEAKKAGDFSSQLADMIEPLETEVIELRGLTRAVANALSLPTENGNRAMDLRYWVENPPVPALPTDSQKLIAQGRAEAMLLLLHVHPESIEDYINGIGGNGDQGLSWNHEKLKALFRFNDIGWSLVTDADEKASYLFSALHELVCEAKQGLCPTDKCSYSKDQYCCQKSLIDAIKEAERLLDDPAQSQAEAIPTGSHSPPVIAGADLNPLPVDSEGGHCD